MHLLHACTPKRFACVRVLVVVGLGKSGEVFAFCLVWSVIVPQLDLGTDGEVNRAYGRGGIEDCKRENSRSAFA